MEQTELEGAFIDCNQRGLGGDCWHSKWRRHCGEMVWRALYWEQRACGTERKTTLIVHKTWGRALMAELPEAWLSDLRGWRPERWRYMLGTGGTISLCMARHSDTCWPSMEFTLLKTIGSASLIKLVCWLVLEWFVHFAAKHQLG